MNCITKRDLKMQILILKICLLVVCIFLYGPTCATGAINVLPEGPIIFPQDPNRETNNKISTRMASDGQGYLCVWQERNDETSDDILGQMVDPNGLFLGATIQICSLTASQTNPDLDSDGANYLIVWMDDRNSETDSDIYGALVSGDGNLLKEIEIEKTSGEQRYPKARWNGQHYLVVWEQEIVSGTKKVALKGKRLDSDGLLIDQQTLDIETDSAFNKRGKKACFDLTFMDDPNIPVWFIAWNGNMASSSESGSSILGKYLAESEDPNIIQIAEPLSDDPNHILISSETFTMQSPFSDQFSPYKSYTNLYYPSIELMGNVFLVVFEALAGEDEANMDIWGAVFTGSSSFPFYICKADQKQEFPEVANNGLGFFALWLDHRESPSFHVYGARISPRGFMMPDNPDDPNALNGTKISTESDQIIYSPAVASTASEDDRYFCLWSSKEDTAFQIIGRIYDPPPPPELEWVGSGDYQEDGVDPNSASGGSEFTFKVKYTSDINEAPVIAQVWIDLNDDGRYLSDERFDMNKEGPETDYTGGVIYSFSRSEILYDGDGDLAYLFFFTDPYNTAIGDPTLGQSFEVIMDGNQPILDWTNETGYKGDGVRPDGAIWGEETSFEFRVTYQDTDGDAPANMELWIDKNGDSSFDPNNERLAMDHSGENYTDGQIFTKTITLGFDIVRPLLYKFESDDGRNKATGDPRLLGGYLSFNPLGETSVCLNYPNQFFPFITGIGSGYQVFWEDRRDVEIDPNRPLGVTGSHIWMELLCKDGTVKEDPDNPCDPSHSFEPGQIKIDTSPMGAFKPSAQFNPETQMTLVVWEDLRHGSVKKVLEEDENIFKPEAVYDGLDIWGMFMDVNGDPFLDPNDPNDTGEFMIAGEGISQNMLNLDMAMDSNGQYIVVWEDESRPFTKTDIFARFVKYPENAYGDKIELQYIHEPLNPPTNHQLFPRVAWNGKCYLAVWQDANSVDLDSGYYLSRIYGRRIDPNGQLHPHDKNYELFDDTFPSDLADPNINQLFPDVASDGENFLIVWQDSRNLGTKQGYDIYGMRVNIDGLAIQYLDVLHREKPICTAEGDQIRPRAFWDPQERQYLITWIEVPYKLAPKNVLSQRTGQGSIKVVRMDPNGMLLDGPSDYKGASPGGYPYYPWTQDHFEMSCDPNLGCRFIWEDTRNTGSLYDIYSASFQSTLNWVDDPNFATKGVNPLVGKAGGTFTFKVEYKDRSDLPAEVAEVWIDLDDDGDFEEDEKFPMDADPNGEIYTYTHQINFPPNSDGRINYLFFFQNNKGRVQGLGSSMGTLGLTITEVPELDWVDEPGYITDGVDPDQGDSGSEFIFKVKYTDPSNIAPAIASILIDRNDDGQYSYTEQLPMNATDPNDEDYSDGKIYELNVTLSYPSQGDGNIKYKFHFSYNNDTMIAQGDPTFDHFVSINEPVPDLKWQTFYKKDGLNGNFIRSLAVDGDNNLWVGYIREQDPDTGEITDTTSGGISRFDGKVWTSFRGPTYLQSDDVVFLAVTPDDHLWALTLSGPSLYDGDQWEKFADPDPNMLVVAVSSDNQGRLWVAKSSSSSASGGYYEDPNAFTLDPNETIISSKLIMYEPGELATSYPSSKFGGNYITSMTADEDGFIWIAMMNIDQDPNKTEFKGIVRFNPENENVDPLETEYPGYPGYDYVYGMARDKEGDIWIISYDISSQSNIQMGLARFKHGDETWTHYINGKGGVQFGSNNIFSLYRRGDHLWLGHWPDGSNPGGATLHEFSSDQWRLFNTKTVPYVKDAFDYINAVVEDNNGITWFGTINGLVRYNPKGVEPDLEVLGPYKGLFNLDEETGCFITRVGDERLRKGWILITFSFIILVLFLIIGFIHYKGKEQQKNKL